MNKRGPASRSGKAAVANSSLKHGLTAAAIVLPSESESDWITFHDELLLRFNAEGPAEIALASRVAELLWRLRRAARAEAQSISVDQLRRDTIVYDRAQTASAPPDVVSEADEASRRAVAREGLTRWLGIYARGEIANETAKRYLETLPVLLAGDAAIEKIMRYEAHLSRLLKHAMHELEALQDRRHGHATPLARVDIN